MVRRGGRARYLILICRGGGGGALSSNRKENVLASNFLATCCDVPAFVFVDFIFTVQCVFTG